MVFFDETSYLIIELFVEKYLPSKIVPTSLFVRPNYQPVGLDLVDVKKIHIKHLPHYLKTLTTHLLDSTWLALTTPMGMP